MQKALQRYAVTRVYISLNTSSNRTLVAGLSENEELMTTVTLILQGRGSGKTKRGDALIM
jgi:phage terminase large subunit-like protein